MKLYWFSRVVDNFLRLFGAIVFSLLIISLFEFPVELIKSILNQGKSLVAADAERWGQFGDFIGGILNPFFGFFSLAALLATLYIQTKELASSTKALQEQSLNVQVQSFEQGLFSLIELLQDNIKELEYDVGGNVFTGRKALQKLYEKFKSGYEVELETSLESDEFKDMLASAKRFYNNNEHIIGYYLRNVEQLLSYMLYKCPDKDVHYLSIIQSQFTQKEAVLIFYYLGINKKFLDTKLYDEDSFFNIIKSENFLSTHHQHISWGEHQ